MSAPSKVEKRKTLSYAGEISDHVAAEGPVALEAPTANAALRQLEAYARQGNWPKEGCTLSLSVWPADGSRCWAISRDITIPPREERDNDRDDDIKGYQSGYWSPTPRGFISEAIAVTDI